MASNDPLDTLDYLAFDADNHYYEALDAFTRHLDPKHGRRTLQWAEIDGRKYHVLGGKVSHAVKNPTFDPIAMPGAMHEYFRGNPGRKNPMEFLREREPICPEYLGSEARVKVMDQQGLEACWLFPTLGVLYEELLKGDPEGVAILYRAFNEWLYEDWGYDYENRIYAAPYIALGDLDAGIRELELALERGARVVVMRPAPVWTLTGPLSPADPLLDPFWARVNEAGITVVIHAGDSGYSSNGYAKDGFGASFEGGEGGYGPSIKMLNIERAAYDWLLTVTLARLFERFPNLRVASVENGSEFLPDLFRKLKSTANKMSGYFKEDPAENFRRHVWINPFWEDDVHEVVEYMGPERVIFGSDWPHIEGMPRPLDFLEELEGFDDKTTQRIVRDNTRELTQLRPA
ncbi:MAG: amidohydrolase family protein [Myxococcota bacterium]